MLQGELLKNHSGILLFGDYLSLRQLHDVLHEVSSAVEHLDRHEALLILAYDVRKAYEHKRETIDPPEHYPEIGLGFGVKLLWPTLLFQCSLLRESLKFFDSSKTQQGVTYLLENLVIEGLHADFSSEAANIIEEWQRLDPLNAVTVSRVQPGAAMFCEWRKRERKARLANLLKAIDGIYNVFYPFLLHAGAENLIDPEDFQAYADLVDFPDPRW